MPLIANPPQDPSVGPGFPGDILQSRYATLGDLVLGGVDEHGTILYLEKLSGWDGATGTTGTVEQRSSDDGAWASPAFLPPRIIEATVTLRGNSFLSVARSLSLLTGRIPLSGLSKFVVSTFGDAMQADVRLSGDILADQKGAKATVSIPLIAPDPRRYSTDTVTASTGLPSTSGGITLPLTLPLTIGATTASGVLSVVNAGNMSTRPVFTITGPCPPCSITHRGTGRTLQIPDAIEAGRSLTIDTDTRTALLDGTARRRIVGGAGLAYEPGTNEVAFSASTYDAGALLKSEHRSAWR